VTRDDDESTVSQARRLMEEVERRVEQRRREGLYGRNDDALPFAEAALEDDLAAAANRLAAAVRVPSIVPDLRVPTPHDGDGEIPESDSVRHDNDISVPVGEAGVPSAYELVLRAVSSAGKKAFRVIAGDRVDRFMDGSVEFFYATAAFAREVCERILALEQRVRDLEEAQKNAQPKGQDSPRKPRSSATTASSAKSKSAATTASSAKSGSAATTASSAKSGSSAKSKSAGKSASRRKPTAK
jgi:hypothetical protein